ncbi:CBS domain-containing protein [Desulfocurvibacter africanus]|uniref:Polynucleotide adenylyltransferase region n=1 Tax=Desulfocurvibacter africanus subsp. africanus str. Walvis Bay TaxID=690850 RepID=F3Z2K1_DESAF|nr:CBS domain-containing protein [Desulfocurvibacter africanus]EGJ51334.1 Polynucleotide adenylyltransferase region [Desulfocurvibacter africanus subsp. africanus str. Walvis Bay]
MTPKIVTDTIVTGHGNADFDCFSSIIAAGKLYPGAALIFPGSQEKSLRNFYIQSAIYLFNFVSTKDIDFAQVKRLVVVDTRQRSRIEHIKAVLDNPGLEIHTYDHHPDSEDDLQAQLEIWKPWGSCAAIIIQQVREKGLDIGPEEATAVGLGLYEDTGSFTFSSTTGYDLEAAAWLRHKGMDLDVVSDLITRELTAQQVSILNTMLESATTHEINGVEVVMAEATTEHYVGDFAFLAHKLMEMENVNALFAMGRMHDRIQLVARSRDERVDVGVICERFGGGGHSYAASASIKDRTPAQVKDDLLSLLLASINTQMTAGKLMSKPAVVVTKNKTMAKSAEIMTRFGLKAVPVVDPEDGHCVGLLEHELADKAIAHGLGDVEVREYMARDVTTLSPSDGLQHAMDVILGQRQRLAPVVDSGRVVGVLTRTDLINILVEEPARIPESLLPEKRQKKSIAGQLRDRLPEDILGILTLAGKLADEDGFEVFAVGGFVRDILLRQPNFDIDLVAEGDGIAFAYKLAGVLGGRVKAHHKFKTAVIILPNGQRIDVATARLEYYEYPAALPVVELSSIKMDLYRRDFTINALAVHLNPGRFGLLEDFFGAQRDIKDKIIRVLHSLSFVEDPTRILRAIRFEQRFEFRIGGQTERLIRNAVQMTFFQKLSGTRIFHELRLIFDERNALRCLRRMDSFALLTHIHPNLTLDDKLIKYLEELESVRNWYRLLYEEPAAQSWIVYLLGLCGHLPPEELVQIAGNLGFTERQRHDFLALRERTGQALGKLINWSQSGEPLSGLYFILHELPVEGVLLLMAKSTRDQVKKAISVYLTRLRHIKLEIGGADLRIIGLEPGPAYGRILREVLAARIDGKAECRGDQLALAESLAGHIPDIKTKKPQNTATPPSEHKP